jgi:hypothetical protein
MYRGRTRIAAHQLWPLAGGMCADRGDAYGEDGYHGRGIAHPVVTTVPFTMMLR